MESKIMFLIIIILLLFALFSKTGQDFVKQFSTGTKIEKSQNSGGTLDIHNQPVNDSINRVG